MSIKSYLRVPPLINKKIGSLSLSLSLANKPLTHRFAHCTRIDTCLCTRAFRSNIALINRYSLSLPDCMRGFILRECELPLSLSAIFDIREILYIATRLKPKTHWNLRVCMRVTLGKHIRSVV